MPNVNSSPRIRFFHIALRPPETKPSPSTAEPAPNPTRSSLDIFISCSTYRELTFISTSDSSPHVPCPPSPMHETRRLVEAASALSAFLQSRGVPHAFYGDALISLLAGQPLAAVRSFVVERQTFLTVCPPANLMHRARRESTSVPPRSRRSPLRGRFLNQLVALVRSVRSDFYLPLFRRPYLCFSLQSTRKIPPLHSPNRSRSCNAYSPTRTHSYPGFMMRSRSFLRGRRVHAASTRIR